MADRNGYIGRAPSDSAVTVARQTFSPTGVTTDFTFASGYTPGYFDIFINGVKMIEGSDYTSTDGSTFSVLNGGAISGDVIEGVAYKAFNAATASVGIYSGGDPISTQANILNFVGTGNTFALRGSTIDISISGGGAGAGGTWANYDTNTGVSTTKKVKIQNDLEVTGVTTSTGGFVGNVTGTATGLSGSPNITINNLTGVAATFTGVLTYEDVTNVDSVGVVTARSGLNVVGGGLTVTGVSSFFSDVVVGGSAGAVGSKVNIFNGSDTPNILGITGADESSEYAAIGVNAGNAIITGGGVGGSSAGIVFRTSSGGTEAEVARLDSSGRFLLGTTVEGFEYVDNFTVADSGNCGITIRSGTTSYGSIYFSNATSGGGEYIGVIEYNHNTNVMSFNAGGGPKLKLNSTGEGKTADITGNLFVSGVATATAFHGDGSNLTNLPAAGVTTEAFTSSGIVTAVRLGTAVDHKITATGFTTITSSGSGTEGESHTIRIVNSGIATVGFSTYFLFPSGAAPSLPTADGAISLISFTVHDSVGAGCTQLLAGASVNFS